MGQDLKPLNKIASGGEVSRVMLALKVIFSKVDNIPILIFDEIDTGIGGETVRKIALKLKEIGENTQIISITHSPVIASKASQQFYIEKYKIFSICLRRYIVSCKCDTLIYKYKTTYPNRGSGCKFL